MLLAGNVAGAEDCARWDTGIETFERPGSGPGEPRLGMPLAAVTIRYEPSPSLSGSRVIDDLVVRAYFGGGTRIETIACADGSELVVGVSVGAFVYGQQTVSQFIENQTAALKTDGARTVRRTERGNDLHLWGIKGRIEGSRSKDVSDYLVLSRRCIRVATPGTEDTCGLSDKRTHWVRSRTLTQ